MLCLYVQLSLTHFCEVHGPTSVLCSQVQPVSCSQCQADDADLSTSDTPSSSSRRRHSRFSSSPANSALSTSFTGSVKSNAAHPPQNLEDLPYFLKSQQSQFSADSRLGETNGDTCASCSISLPEDVSKKLPANAPANTKGDAKAKNNNNSPVLRSREVVYSCGGSHSESEDEAHDPHLHASPPDSQHSFSVSSDVSCHTHILTYLSLHGPPRPTDYALLRQSCIRTLSCELLPRGLSSGRLCFGDPVAGYTIAYVFRLPDPMARGKRRSYALVALAGTDATRAFRASPIIWRIFQRIATSIVTAAEKHQEEEKKREEQAFQSPKGSNYTPVSSFLTGRAYDPNGNPRRAGQIRARNLAEIVSNEYIFAELHAQFVTLLQQLGNMFGGVPMDPVICSTVMPEETAQGESRRGSVATTSMPAKSDAKPARHTRGPSDLDLSSLNMSSRPQPIPISPRRPIAT